MHSLVVHGLPDHELVGLGHGGLGSGALRGGGLDAEGHCADWWYDLLMQMDVPKSDWQSCGGGALMGSEQIEKRMHAGK